MAPFVGGARGALAVLSLLLLSGAAAAQSADCARLQAQISSVRGNPGEAQRILAAAQRQQRELDRVTVYARSIGCENHQFLFFGSAPPPQCDQIRPQVERLRASLERLQQQAAQVGGEGERRALRARYDAACGARAGLGGARSFFQQLFGGQQEPSQPPPPGPVVAVPITPPAASESAGGGSKAVCVRTCDGGFFPVSYAANRSKYSDLQAQCDALCPNVPTRLYTYPGSGVIDQAVSAADGKPYSAMPNAGLYRSHYDASCTCKPPHESWAQALAGAEELNGSHTSDIIVTQEKSDQMVAHSAGAAPAPAKTRKGRGKGSAATLSGASPGANAGASTDDQTALDLANSAAGPTVGQESSDIGSGAPPKAKNYGESQGKVVEETGPDGVKRRVRIIGPSP